MSRQTLEGWATKINDLADHTYVYCPDTNKYFVCWGGHSGPDKRKICSGSGIYDVANCYRKPAFGREDTAGIGVYAINGVCHQSANCFLYSTDPTVTLNIAVRGYFASLAAYGTYGTGFILPWLPFVYNPCYQKYKDENITNSLSQKLHQAFSEVSLYGDDMNKNEIVIKELAITSEHHAPGIDSSRFEDLHRDFLAEKDSVIASGLQGEALAQKINDLSIEFQKRLSESVSEEEYEKLTGMKKGETINIVDPSIAAEAAKHKK